MSVKTKQPSELKVFSIDFVNLLADGDSLSSIDSGPTGSPSGLTISNAAISGTAVEFNVESGEDGVTYTIEVVVNTANGEVLEGEGYLFVTDDPQLYASNLHYSYSDLQTAIADFLGWSRSAGNWTDEDVARMDAIIKSAITQVYYPQSDPQRRRVHQWSWMRPVSPLVTSAPYDTGTVEVVAGVVTLAGGTFPSWAAQGEIEINSSTYLVQSRDSDTQITLEDGSAAADAGSSFVLSRYMFDLPRAFGGLVGDITYARSQTDLYPALDHVPDVAIRKKRQSCTETGHPRWFSIRPKAFSSPAGQRWQIVMHPTPDAEYRLEYRYKIKPTTVNSSYPYPMGGPDIGELILLACLAVAEQRYTDQAGHHTEIFMSRIQSAVQNDQQETAPDFLGYNSDNSDAPRRDEYGHRVAIHSYEGQYYYDRNRS